MNQARYGLAPPETNTEVQSHQNRMASLNLHWNQ